MLAADNITIELPGGHSTYSVVVDDATGRRVRNLVKVQPVTNTTMSVAWDGKNENGETVPPGPYTVRGVSHAGFGAKYQYAWYNPGNPPWEGYRGSGWGGDHSGQSGIVAVPAGVESPWRVIISGEIAEGGDAVFALDRDFKKVWGYKRGWSGSRSLCVADGHLYMTLWTANTLLRFSLANGQTVPFQRPAGVVTEIKLDGAPFSVAVSPAAIAVVVRPERQSPKLVFFDKQAGRVQKEWPLTHAGELAYDATGRLWFSGEGRLAIFDEAGQLAPVELPGVAKAGAFCFDVAGALYVMDTGPDFQIKVFVEATPPSLLPPSRSDGGVASTWQPLRTIGVKGGQGQRLDYDPQAMQRMVGAMTVDAEGLVWTTEPLHPRRQAVWGADGKLVRQFVGGTQYGGSHCALHDQDPTVGVAYGVLFRLDPAATQDYRPWRYLSRGPKEGSPFQVDLSGGDFFRGTLFRSDVSGRMREYYVEPWMYGYILFVEKDGDYRPCAALFNPRHWVLDENTQRSPAYRQGDPTGRVKFWSDWNEDELIQEEELQVVPEFPEQEPAWVRPFGGWVRPMHPDLGFYVNAWKILPQRFTPSGAPIYDVSKAEPFADPQTTAYSDFHRAGNHLFGNKYYPQVFHGRHVFTDLTGRQIGFFEYNRLALHGSMNKPIPLPGETAGEQFLSGVADSRTDVGTVIAYHGNFGQVFLFSEDGIFLGNLFRDAREPNTPYGDKVVRDADWSAVTMSQEPFGGWFGRQADGKVRYLFGRNAACVVEVTGLEQLKQFTAGVVEISP